MKTIRRSVFETNSSSTHSISIKGEDNFRQRTISKGSVMTGHFDEFGWGYEKLNTVHERLSYVLTMIQYKCDCGNRCEDVDAVKDSIYYKWLSEMIAEYTGASLEIDISSDNYYPMGYIDHQSIDTLDDFWSEDEVEFKSKIKDIIFNDKYTIIIDNDNH